MPISIRRATTEDVHSVSRICLLTGEAGQSAESVYSIPELIGLVYAVPYLFLENAFAYVLVTTDPLPSTTDSIEGSTGSGAGHPVEGKEEEERIIGYIVGAVDTRAFEAEAATSWWPIQRAKYPPLPPDSEPTTSTADTNTNTNTGQTTPLNNPNDIRLINLFSNPPHNPDPVVSLSPAHMHINVLPEAQKKGWGRRLVDTAVQHVRLRGIHFAPTDNAEGGPGKRVEGGKSIHLGIDPRNDEARKFYTYVGFQRVDSGGDGEYYALDFNSWVPPSK